MVPARNLLRRHYDSYGGGGGCFDVDSCYKQSPPSSLIRSNLMMMAEHHTPTTTTTTTTAAGGPAAAGEGQEQQETTQEQESEQNQEVGTSKPPAPADDSWLKLGIGVSTSSSSSSAAASFTPAAAVPGPSVELQLFSDKPSSSQPPRPTMPMSSPAPPPQSGYRPPPWGFWNMGGAGSSSGTGSSMPQQSTMSSMMMRMPQLIYNVQRQRFPAVEGGGPHLGEVVRVVSPPVVRRQQATGVWFLLKATENQVREPFLPQIPKSYIRIKDCRMTVRLLMKYLVKKLGLDHESEVQISCRGQPLPPLLTLQHVRDHIWCLSEAVAFLPDSPSIDHVMTLEYSRSP